MDKNAARRRHTLSTRYRQKGTLRGVFESAFSGLFKTSSLKITIKGQTLTFENINDFNTFLSGKTEIPASKMQQMLERTDIELQDEIKQLSQVEQIISEKLSAVIRDPKSIDNYLENATMMRFSQDYDWRQIMFELSKQQSTEVSEYKYEAVSHYLKYLHARLNIANSILADKNRAAKPSKERLDDAPSTSTVETVSIEGTRIHQHKSDIPDSSSKRQDKEFTSGDLKRIPRDQAVTIDTKSIVASSLPIQLADREFTLEMGNPPNLVSKSGDSYPLKQGKNLIGRSTRCSIILNPEFTDISRRHLIIELRPDGALRCTDLSSAGTQLPAGVIKD